VSAVARAAVFGIAGFALAANALLWLGLRVPHWLFPAAVAIAIAGTWRTLRRARAPRGAAEWLTALALALTLAAVCHGCLATSSREWDGAVAWELKAKALAADPTTGSTFLSTPEVYVHSRDYPLLQPLCQASLSHWLGERLGRLLFPSLWLVLAGLCWRTATHTQRSTLTRCATVLGAALMPALVSPGGGAVDSGYGELFLATALAAVATSFLTGDRPLLLAGAVVMLLVKPEGPYYLVALAAALLGRWTCLVLLCLVPVAAFFANYSLALIPGLAPILAAEATHALQPNKLGSTYVLLAALALAPGRAVGPCPAPALLRFVLYGLLLIAGSFLVSSGQSVEHHVRSSMSRLLLQWSVPAWLLAAAWLARDGRAEGERGEQVSFQDDRRGEDEAKEQGPGRPG
jgi:hypothetical protein